MRWQDCWKRTGTDPQHFSRDFLKRLWRFANGRVRVRWSEEFEQWVIEYKTSASIERIPSLQQWKPMWNGTKQVFVENDSWIQACDGYVTIDRIHPKAQIEQRLIENLQYFDLARWGGSAAFIREVDEQTVMRERLMKKKHSDKNRAIAEDVYDTLKHAMGEAAFVPTPKDGGNEWLAKEHPFHGTAQVITGGALCLVDYENPAAQAAIEEAYDNSAKQWAEMTGNDNELLE